MSVTTAPGLDLNAHADAIKALLTAQFDGNAAVYRQGQVPGLDGNDGALLPRFAVIAIARRPVGISRITGQAGRSSWRVTLWWVGVTDDMACWVQQQAALALDEQLLTVAGRLSTPLAYESGDDPRPTGDGHYAGRTKWTYAL